MILNAVSKLLESSIWQALEDSENFVLSNSQSEHARCQSSTHTMIIDWRKWGQLLGMPGSEVKSIVKVHAIVWLLKYVCKKIISTFKDVRISHMLK